MNAIPRAAPEVAPARARARLAAFGALLVLVTVVLGVLVGAGDLADPRLRDTYLALRGARLAACAVMGAALAVAGTLVQGLFRNPLADTGVIGTTAGAVLGGKLTLVAVDLTLGIVSMHGIMPDLFVPIGSMVGAAGSLFVLALVARRARSILVLLLVGFALSSLFGSLGGLLTVVAQDRWELGRALVSFGLGSVSGTSARQIAFAVPFVAVACMVGIRHSSALDLLLSGEDEATTLGLDVRYVRISTACWIAVLTGAAVSLGGFVSFVGLVVPHALRPFLGAEHRNLTPFAALYGAVFVMLADVVARLAPTRGELPLGIVTGVVGAPIFLVLLLRAHREGRIDA